MRTAVRFRGWPNFLWAQQLEKEDILGLFEQAEVFRRPNSMDPRKNITFIRSQLESKIVGICSAEPSMKTIRTFEAAAHRLGTRCVTYDHFESFSSKVKGVPIEASIAILETLEDFDCLVLRLPLDLLERAVRCTQIPIINAGADTDIHQHPIQALCDLYIGYLKLDRLDGLRVLMLGNLQESSSAHSLVYFLSKFEGVSFTFYSPEGRSMEEGIITHLKEHGIKYSAFIDRQINLLDLIRERSFNYVYLLRPQSQKDQGSGEQKPYLGDLASRYSAFQVTSDVIDALNEKAIIQHPMPPTQVELPYEIMVAHDSRSGGKITAIESIQTGVYLKMALLRCVMAI